MEDQDSHGIAEIAHGHPQVDYRGPKPKGQVGGGVHLGACGNHLGPGKAQGLRAVEHQQKLEEDVLLPPRSSCVVC